MNLSDLISNIHWFPVISMTVLSFAIGFAWHQPFMFGKIWKKENNYGDKTNKINATIIFGGTAIMHFIAFAGLSAIVAGQGGFAGFKIGIFISLVWIVPAISGTYLFANRSLKLLAIDSGMYIVLFPLFGLILGVW